MIWWIFWCILEFGPTTQWELNVNSQKCCHNPIPENINHISRNHQEWSHIFGTIRPKYVISSSKRRFPKMGVSQNGWLIMENPKQTWMIWGYPHFGKPLNHGLWGVSFAVHSLQAFRVPGVAERLGPSAVAQDRPGGTEDHSWPGVEWGGCLGG